MKNPSHDIERFRQAATFLIQTFALLARAQFCLRQKPVWTTGSGIQKHSSLDFCAAKCRPSFPGGKSGLRNEKRPFLVSPSAPQFGVGKSRVFILPKDDISVNSIFSGRTLILHPAFSSKGRLCPNCFAGRPQFGQSALFPFNRRFDQRENPPE